VRDSLVQCFAILEAGLDSDQISILSNGQTWHGKLEIEWRESLVPRFRATADTHAARLGKGDGYNVIVSSLNQIRRVATADFPTRWGKFQILGFERDLTQENGQKQETAVALVMGDIHSSPPLVRIHSQCLTGDVFGSLRCDCRQQLEMALSMIADQGAGILIYEQQEGRGIGLMAKLQAYALQDAGLDTVEANERLGFKADQREFALPGEILNELGVKKLRLLSNNPEKVAAVEAAGVQVVERVPCEAGPNPDAEEYLKTKKEKMGHLFTSR